MKNKKYNHTVNFSIDYTLNFDFEKEIKRIKKCFGGKKASKHDEDIGNKLIEMIDLFVDGDIHGCMEAWEKLPYDEKAECHAREYVGPWLDTYLTVANGVPLELSQATSETMPRLQIFQIMKAKVIYKRGEKEHVRLNTIDKLEQEETKKQEKQCKKKTTKTTKTKKA